MIAQKILESYDLGSTGLPPCELVTSSEPCSQCFGAILWSGVQRVVCGARAEDVEAIGFDEGPKPRGWVEELRRRRIGVVQDVLRTEAVAVLRYFESSGKAVYNPSRKES
jgi:tRNA(Arg) A34 adenosine deaminase TadA